MIIEYDKIADALYISLKKSKVDKTIKMKDRLLVDVDKKGNTIGIEILDVSRQLPKKNLVEISLRVPVADRILRR
ncbi:DUF2283 domain-containing protein [Candidatus Parcubacteria bacterium]|nr:DUF2283 domain-containing protein [Candidatus Parcubacteria bacterium]